jgi:catechol 2,3-dioxygenase-like lactoylglutathione lyase family enzyme
MIRTEGLGHIDLAVSDVARSLAFYQGVFGMTVLFSDGPDEYFLRTPGARDVIGISRAEKRAPGAKGGIGHFGFRLVSPSDMDEAIATVASLGGKLLRRGGEGMNSYAYVTDPDGYEIEFFCD